MKQAQTTNFPLKLINNNATHQNPDKYSIMRVALKSVVESYRGSLFSFEWLDKNGAVRDHDSMEDTQKSKYDSVYAAYKTGIPLERPILGIGLSDNIEIGSRRDVLLTLYSLGIKELDVHIPQSCLSDFKKFEC